MQITISVKRTHNKEVEQALWQGIDRGMEDLADYIFARSQEFCPVDESTLKKSGYVEHEVFLKKVVGYDALHAAHIEFGTKPHYLPRSAIDGELTRWAMRVLGLSEKEANKAAWGIAGKIAALGGEAQPYLRPAADEGKVKAEGIIRNAMR
jgi:hypothetical protein